MLLADGTKVEVGGAVKNNVLMFNGSLPVWAASGTTFTFSCTGFSHAEGSPKLVGLGVWKAQSAMGFSATYNNGPPTSALVKMSDNGGAYSQVGAMTGPAYTSGANSSGAINYPSPDHYLAFRLDSTDGTDPDIDDAVSVYFYNNVYWGIATKNSGFSAGDITGLGNSAVTSSYTASRSYSGNGSGKYLVIAFPARYSSIHATGFLYNNIACPMTLTTSTLSITNGSSYAENYKVYASDLANIGNYTLQLSTGSLLINPLYYGVTTKTSGYNEADVEGLANAPVSNDVTQVWNALSVGGGQYMLFAFPTRLCSTLPTFWVGGFEGGFQSPETVAVTNANGYQENYYVWRSTNSGLGTTIVETK